VSVATENIKIALKSVRSQLLRTILTVLMIAIGITALVGILTSIDAIKYKLTADFSQMGSNSFTIRNLGMNLSSGRRGKAAKAFPPITYDQALVFSERFEYPAAVSVSALASMLSTVKYESKKTNPNVRILGSDPSYLQTSGYELESGRNFIPADMKSGAHVCIVGMDVVTMLFENEDPLDKFVSIGAAKYKIIGVLKGKGSSIGMSADNQCLVTLSNVRQYYYRPEMSFTINVQALGPENLEETISEATGLFRIVRKVPPGQDSSFEITKSDSLAAFVIDNLSMISLVATIIAIITLLGSTIGLMNIMLVSVTERTREIGVRKAVGASASTIRWQFLIEAIVIGQIGGAFGIIFGLLIGNGISLAMSGVFVVPWNWIFGGAAICFIVGVVSGFYPAQKAAALDPIDSLRHE
jgi:putative ABC transport system permease protein